MKASTLTTRRTGGMASKHRARRHVVLVAQMRDCATTNPWTLVRFLASQVEIGADCSSAFLAERCVDAHFTAGRREDDSGHARWTRVHGDRNAMIAEPVVEPIGITSELQTGDLDRFVRVGTQRQTRMWRSKSPLDEEWKHRLGRGLLQSRNLPLQHLSTRRSARPGVDAEFVAFRDGVKRSCANGQPIGCSRTGRAPSHPSAERAALGDSLIDDCDQLQVRVSDGYYPVRGAPIRMVPALDGLESESVVEDATTGRPIRRREQHVIDGQLRKTRRNSIRPSSVHRPSLPAQDARTRGPTNCPLIGVSAAVAEPQIGALPQAVIMLCGVSAGATRFRRRSDSYGRRATHGPIRDARWTRPLNA